MDCKRKQRVNKVHAWDGYKRVSKLQFAPEFSGRVATPWRCHCKSVPISSQTGNQAMESAPLGALKIFSLHPRRNAFFQPLTEWMFASFFPLI